MTNQPSIAQPPQWADSPLNGLYVFVAVFLSWFLWFMVEVPLSCIDDRWWNVAFFATGAIAAAAMVVTLTLVARGRDSHLPMNNPPFTTDGDTLTVWQDYPLQFAQIIFHVFAAVACLIFGVGVPVGFVSVDIFAGQRHYLPVLVGAIGLYSLAIAIIVLARGSTGRITISPRGVVYVSLASRRVVSWNATKTLYIYRRTIRKPYCVIGLELGNNRVVKIYADYFSLHAPAVLWLLKHYKENPETDANSALDRLYFEASTASGEPGRI